MRRTFAITAAALFMFSLDRTVVLTALPDIGADLGAGLRGLQWTLIAGRDRGGFRRAVGLMAGAAALRGRLAPARG
jgi:hypothetical protein